MIIDHSMLGKFKSQVRRERKVGIFDEDLYMSLLDNQASSLRFMGWVDIFLVFRVLRIIEPFFCSTFELSEFFLDASDPSAFSSLSVPLLPPPPIISFSLTLKADVTDNLVVFNIAMSDIAILLKPWMKS